MTYLDTTIGAKVPRIDIKQLIKINIRDEELVTVKEFPNSIELVLIHGDVDADPFILPQSVRVGVTNRYYVDLRRFCLSKPKPGSPFEKRIKDTVNAELYITAAYLSALWETGNIRFEHGYRYPYIILAQIISSKLSTIFHTTDIDASFIKVLLGVMFTDMTLPEIDAHSSTRLTSIATISRADGYDITTVLDILDGMKIRNLSEFVNVLPEVLESSTMKSLKEPHIIAAITKTFSTFDSVFTGIAVEYPPFWIAMFDTITRSKSFRYKRAVLAMGGINEKSKSINIAVANTFSEESRHRLL